LLALEASIAALSNRYPELLVLIQGSKNLQSHASNQGVETLGVKP